MARKPNTAEVTTPTSNVVTGIVLDSSLDLSSSVYITAASVIGMLRRNENRALASLVNPNARPAVMVMPERDTPGTSASAWARPTPIAVPQPGTRSSRPGLENRSTAHSSTPNPMSSDAMIGTAFGSERSLSSRSPSFQPAMSPGTVATARVPNSRRASRCLVVSGEKKSTAMRRQSSRYANTSASSVPAWSAMSNVVPAYGQPSSVGNRNRWALLEIGSSSVRPWTMPSTNAWNTVSVGSAARGMSMGRQASTRASERASG